MNFDVCDAMLPLVTALLSSRPSVAGRRWSGTRWTSLPPTTRPTRTTDTRRSMSLRRPTAASASSRTTTPTTRLTASTPIASPLCESKGPHWPQRLRPRSPRLYVSQWDLTDLTGLRVSDPDHLASMWVNGTSLASEAQTPITSPLCESKGPHWPQRLRPRSPRLYVSQRHLTGLRGSDPDRLASMWVKGTSLASEAQTSITSPLCESVGPHRPHWPQSLRPRSPRLYVSQRHLTGLRGSDPDHLASMWVKGISLASEAQTPIALPLSESTAPHRPHVPHVCLICLAQGLRKISRKTFTKNKTNKIF